MEQNRTLNVANAHLDGAVLLESGNRLGRHQAFGLIANKCSAIRRGVGKSEGVILVPVLTDAISRFEEASITIAEAKESEIFAGGRHTDRRPNRCHQPL